MNSRPGGNLFKAINNLNADVLAIHEVDYLQPRSQNVKQVEEIAERCGFLNWAFAPALDGRIIVHISTGLDAGRDE